MVKPCLLKDKVVGDVARRLVRKSRHQLKKRRRAGCVIEIQRERGEEARHSYWIKVPQVAKAAQEARHVACGIGQCRWKPLDPRVDIEPEDCPTVLSLHVDIEACF